VDDPRPDAEVPSDEELVRRVLAGDADAAGALFDRHAAEMRSSVRRRLPQTLRAKVGESDVVQEAWIAAYLALPGFEDRGGRSFAKWLQRIVSNKVKDEIRRHAGVGKRDARREERLATDAPVGDTGQATPSAEVASVESSAALSAAIDELPSDQAAVLRWIHREGLTLVEAGERMGRSADAVRKLYGRALVRLGGRLRGGPDSSS
jgi:RNA polymerase sigma-70 factor (ECF subfamily)